MGMMHTLIDYRSQLLNLLPPGRAWPSLCSVTRLVDLLTTFAAELLQVDTRNTALLNNLMPDSTDELLPEWERVLALPDPCVTSAQTTQQRVAAVIARIGLNGSLSEQFYIDLAAQLGYAITITILGANQWQVNAPATTITYFRAGVSSAGDPLQQSDNDLLICTINKTKPAHTSVTFNYI